MSGTSMLAWPVDSLSAGSGKRSIARLTMSPYAGEKDENLYFSPSSARSFIMRSTPARSMSPQYSTSTESAPSVSSRSDSRLCSSTGVPPPSTTACTRSPRICVRPSSYMRS